MKREYLSNGAKLAYYDARSNSASGDPVVFLHPTPLSHAYWLPVIARLRGRHAIAPDLRGHGASELEGSAPDQKLSRGAFVPGIADLTMEILAADVITLLDQLGIEKTPIVGCSIGGYVALELWRRIPERISGLAFICSKPQPDTDAARQKRRDTIARFDTEDIATVLAGMVESLTGASSKLENPHLVAELVQMATLTREAAQAVQAGLALRPDSLPTVTTITVPLYALHGTDDQVITGSEMRALMDAPGDSSFHLLEHAGHFAACERPEYVAESLRNWLKTLA